MFVHTVIMVIEPHMKQGRQHKLISTIFLATSVTKKLDHNTIGQDKNSCVVYGMPMEAHKIGAVCQQCPLNTIGQTVLARVSFR